MTTWGDMMSLLLAFFIFLFNVGEEGTTKYKMAISSFRQSLGVFPSSISVLRPDEVLLVPSEKGTKNFWGEEKQMAELQKKLEQEIDKMVESKNVGQYQQVKRGEQELFITLGDGALFDSGSDSLKPEFTKILDKIAGEIKKYNLQMMVEGHTDDRPINTARFPSNWELSTARATQVIRYMINNKGISPENLIATGYGESKPKGSNDTAEGRSRNRRIEIKLSPTNLTPVGGAQKVKDMFQGAGF